MTTELVPVSPSIATLDRFVAPPGLDGSQGANRMERDLKVIDADNDLDAINAWLSSLTNAEAATVSSYRNVLEKILNWTCFARGKAFSSLNQDDFRAFVEFLAAPRPALDWICGYAAHRSSLEWRPFKGPLSRASIRFVLSVTSNLFEWLGSTGYALMPRIESDHFVRTGGANSGLIANISTTSQPRILSQSSWDWVKQHLMEPIDPVTRLAVELEYFANLRPNEIRRLRLADCIAPSEQCVAWRLQMDSMPNRMRCIYAVPPLGRSLSNWFKELPGAPSLSLSTTEIRAKSTLLFAGSLAPDHRVRGVLIRAAELAEVSGDARCGEELRAADQRCFRGALEEHAGSDQAFIMGFIANARGSRRPIGQYCKEIVLDNDAIEAGWKRLAGHWQTYKIRVA